MSITTDNVLTPEIQDRITSFYQDLLSERIDHVTISPTKGGGKVGRIVFEMDDKSTEKDCETVRKRIVAKSRILGNILFHIDRLGSRFVKVTIYVRNPPIHFSRLGVFSCCTVRRRKKRMKRIR